MGMYSALVFECELNRLGLNVVKNVMKSEYIERWTDVGLAAFGEDAANFANLSRSGFIPFGRPCYNKSEIAKLLGFTGLNYNESWFEPKLDGNVWKVSCDLKNYSGEIKYFLDHVLPHLISEPCTAYERYEEDEPGKWIKHDIEPWDE